MNKKNKRKKIKKKLKLWSDNDLIIKLMNYKNITINCIADEIYQRLNKLKK